MDSFSLKRVLSTLALSGLATLAQSIDQDAAAQFNTKACDAPLCDAMPDYACRCDSRQNPYTQDILPSMFGDGGLVLPRSYAAVAGLQISAQNHIYKVAENNSAIPQDRIGFNFNSLQDVYIGQDNGAAVHRDLYEYRLFAEKTFMEGRFSLDFMVPFYTTADREYDSALDLVVNAPRTDGAFGDLAFGVKTLLQQSHQHAISAGLRVEAPTEDAIVSPSGASVFYRSIEDDVWKFTPYLASLWNPTENVFAQSFLSYRLNSGSVDDGVVLIREQDYLMADVSLGYWLHRNSCSRGLTGLASILELHYTGTMNDEQLSSSSASVTRAFYGNSDRLNLTAGLTAILGDRLTAGMAIAVPLRDEPTNISGASVDTDRAYDWALLTQLTYHFGR